MRGLADIRRAVVLAGAAAALGLLSFPPFPLRFLSLIALGPLLWTIDQPPRRLFLWTWLFGGLAAGFHLWWLWFLIVPIETVTRVLLNIGVALLFAYLGLYTAVFAVLVRRIGLWSAPLVWPVLEYARTQLQIAFPWDLLGYSLTPYVSLIQPASLGGVFLVSGWIVLINLLVYRLLRRPRRVVSAVLLILAFAGPLLQYWLRLRPKDHGVRVAVVQPNVSPFDKGDLNSRERILDDLVGLTRAAASSRPKLAIYPETATLLDVTKSTAIGPRLRSAADSLGLEIFTGTPLYDDSNKTWHNGAVLIRPREWPPAQRYYKMRLVPFSEKIPYVDELPLLRRILGTADMGNWSRGTSPTLFRWSGGTLGCLICYEAIFPAPARTYAIQGADLLVNVTNDGWFGRLPGAHQHKEMSFMRTVETGLPLVRCANNGVSAVVDPYGQVLARTGFFDQEVLISHVPRPAAATPYRRSGDWFVAIAAAITLVGLGVRLARDRRRQR